jgi:hypothetical protein
MTDWKQGGWIGSLNGWVRREIHEHFRANPSAKRTRYSGPIRLLHRIFDGSTFGWFIALYIVFALLIGVAEIIQAKYFPNSLPQWTSGENIKSLLTNVASYLLSAQVGALSVVSIAIGLVTIIAQHENSSTDVQVYYHESVAFGVVASSIALIAALCAQLLWPVQFILHWFGYGTGLSFFKIIVTTVHIAWFLLNLGAMAHFVAITLAFVQRSARENLRERYTTNVVLPVEMSKRLREQLYLIAGPEIVTESWPEKGAEWLEPSVRLGLDFDEAGEIEIPLKPGKRLILGDVRMAWVRWAIGRWLKRCHETNTNQQNRPEESRSDGPLLLIPVSLDETADVRAALCRRRGGVPLSRAEKLALRWAFKFRKIRSENKLPTPAEILEELVDRAALQIDNLAPVAFDAAVKELTRYHRFLLIVNAATTPDGKPFNYAVVPGEAWSGPHNEWIREYRRLFERAASRIGGDSDFLQSSRMFHRACCRAGMIQRCQPRSCGQPLISVSFLFTGSKLGLPNAR